MATQCEIERYLSTRIEDAKHLARTADTANERALARNLVQGFTSVLEKVQRQLAPAMAA